MGAPWINRNQSDSRWIGVDPAVTPPGNNFYGYRTRFDLTGFDSRNVTLTGLFQVDGAATRVLLNGFNIPNPLNLMSQRSYSTGFVTLTFTNGFVPGVNSLELLLTNAVTPPNTA